MAPNAWLELIRRAGVTPAEATALTVLLAGCVCLSALVWTRAAAPAPAVLEPVEVTSGPAPTTSATILVDVAGMVRAPGLVELVDGARVADAIRAAGGIVAGADTSGLNLARPLRDGEQVRVTDEATTGGRPHATDGPDPITPEGLLDLNLATATDLQQLPGIGPVTAERIVAHRDQTGGFVDVVELLEVPGIGPARFATLEPLVTL